MKRLTILVLSLSLLVTGCGRVKHWLADSPPPAPVADPSPTAAPNPTQIPAAPTLDFASMTFVEKNDLYLTLLNENQSAGVDTGQAEEAYVRSLEASLEGNSAEADQYLEQAILMLWNR